jgi:hypothetical protein
VTIPATALTGSTRMRVRIVEDDMFTQGSNFNILPCNASTSATDVMDWGETEDYTIMLVNPVGMIDTFEKNKSVLTSNIVDKALVFNPNLQSNIIFQIVNINGQVVQSGNLSANEKQLNIAHLTEGIYFIQLFDKHTSLGQQKFVKVN